MPFPPLSLFSSLPRPIFHLYCKVSIAFYIDEEHFQQTFAKAPTTTMLDSRKAFTSMLKLFLIKVLRWALFINSILLHSGLNPTWHFWLSTRFCCCLKMISVENILGYIQENLWNCSRIYTKMFKTDSFLGNKKSSLNQNVWRDHATMQQDVLLHFWVIFLYWNQVEIWKKYSFSLSTPMENSAVCQL